MRKLGLEFPGNSQGGPQIRHLVSSQSLRRSVGPVDASIGDGDQARASAPMERLRPGTTSFGGIRAGSIRRLSLGRDSLAASSAAAASSPAPFPRPLSSADDDLMGRFQTRDVAGVGNVSRKSRDSLGVINSAEADDEARASRSRIPAEALKPSSLSMGDAEGRAVGHSSAAAWVGCRFEALTGGGTDTSAQLILQPMDLYSCPSPLSSQG